jgi:hypothetical protein
MAKVVEGNALFVPLGAFTPLRPRTNEADIPFEGVAKLGQFIEAKLSQPSTYTRNPRIIFARVYIFIRVIRPTPHCSKLEKDKALSVATYSLLPKENRSAVVHPDQQRDKNEQR